jgi:hypothetical protein
MASPTKRQKQPSYLPHQHRKHHIDYNDNDNDNDNNNDNDKDNDKDRKAERKANLMNQSGMIESDNSSSNVTSSIKDGNRSSIRAYAAAAAIASFAPKRTSTKANRSSLSAAVPLTPLIYHYDTAITTTNGERKSASRNPTQSGPPTTTATRQTASSLRGGRIGGGRGHGRASATPSSGNGRTRGRGKTNCNKSGTTPRPTPRSSGGGAIPLQVAESRPIVFMVITEFRSQKKVFITTFDRICHLSYGKLQ